MSALAAGDSTEVEVADALSGAGTLTYIGLGIGLPLLEDGECGERQALRTTDTLLTSVLLSQLLKDAFHEQRPDASSNDSFPSGHATAAFAIAAMRSEYEPGEAAYWYAGATAIAWSRVRLNRHRVKDVLAGAALGYGVAQLELSLPQGLLLQPWIDDEGACVGCQICWEP